MHDTPTELRTLAVHAPPSDRRQSQRYTPHTPRDAAEWLFPLQVPVQMLEYLNGGEWAHG